MVKNNAIKTAIKYFIHRIAGTLFYDVIMQENYFGVTMQSEASYILLESSFIIFHKVNTV